MPTLKIRVGNSQLEFQSNDMRDIHYFSSIWGMLPDTCQACKSSNVALGFKSIKAKKDGKIYQYCTFTCKDCTAEMTIKQAQDGRYYIEKDEVMQVYVPETPLEQPIGPGPQVSNTAQQVQQTFQGQQIAQGNPAQQQPGNPFGGNDQEVPF